MPNELMWYLLLTNPFFQRWEPVEGLTADVAALETDEARRLRSAVAGKFYARQAGDRLKKVTLELDFEAMVEDEEMRSALRGLDIDPDCEVTCGWRHERFAVETHFRTVTEYIEYFWWLGQDFFVIPKEMAWFISIDHEGAFQFVAPSDVAAL